jgi:DNA-binding transcriptional regulator YhcF (GntR family)
MYSRQMNTTPPIQIDLNGALPVNRQIVDQLRTLLVEGVLQAGNVLPSVRRLAIDLGVHFNTVADAYRTLANEGWLEISHGRGVRVVPRATAPADDDTFNTFVQHLRQLVAQARAQGISEAKIAQELLLLAEGLRS